MRLAIMQPYFMPYIGYFQLIQAVDKFVVYDNIQFTKKGWINRNRILVNGKDEYITLPLKKDSDYLDINQRNLAESFSEDRSKILRKISESYKKAPFFKETSLVIEKLFAFSGSNLFDFIHHSIHILCTTLQIATPIIVSSTLTIDHTLKAENKVLAICKQMGATHYINPIGGVNLYDKDFFALSSIKLNFLQTKEINYPQLKGHSFVPFLSIIDVLMFNSIETISNYLKEFDLK